MRHLKLFLALGLTGLLTLLTIQSSMATTTGGIQTPSYLPIIFKDPTRTPTATSSATVTRTNTPTATTTRTPTRTATGPTPTVTRTRTATATVTPLGTKTRTPTPTRTEPPPAIQIAFIDFWPGGNEAQNEYVRIENHGVGPTTMTNWTLCDVQNNCYVFPAFTLNAGAAVKVWTGSVSGATATPVPPPLNLYWGRNDPVWDNSGDTATLRNASNVLIDTYTYAAPLRQASGKPAERSP